MIIYGNRVKNGNQVVLEFFENARLINRANSCEGKLKNNYIRSSIYDLNNDVRKLRSKVIFNQLRKNFGCIVEDKNNNLIAEFIPRHHGIFKYKLNVSLFFDIKYNNEILKVYYMEDGGKVKFLIYLNNVQIAEIIRLFKNNNYYIFLLDEYSRYKDILIDYTVYINDYYFYRYINIVYSNHDYIPEYDKNWLDNNFASDKLEQIKKVINEQDIENKINAPKLEMKRNLKFIVYLFLFFASIFLIIILMGVINWFI